MKGLSLDEQHQISGATPWYPHRREGADQPDTATGELVALDSVWSDYHEGLRILAVICEDGGAMWSVRTYPTRLHDEWLAVRPQLGERISVKFLGMLERKKDGKPYPDFSVAAERPGPKPKFNYDRIDRADDHLPVAERQDRGAELVPDGGDDDTPEQDYLASLAPNE
jgi:hypothetical protein